MKKHTCSGKSYSPTKVKSLNFLTNISYNRLKSIYFDNATFIIDCYMYIMLNLNPFFLEQIFEGKNYLILSKLYNYICRNHNFIELSKLSLKYQNVSHILNCFILEDNTNFSKLKDYFKKNALIFQFVYSTLFPKYICRVDNYGVKNKLTFEVAHTGYQNQKENLGVLQQQQQQAIRSVPLTIKQEQKHEIVEIINEKPTLANKKKKERLKS